MKILRLRLTNLNSLRGPTEIDFTRPPLGSTGLFAITGPTGAGKSTLLDAITLALYGRVARYGATPNPDTMMSRHAGECSAEVEFACAAGTFRSSWHLQRARKKPDGNLQPPRRRVVALPAETIVAESIKDADARIATLTGLDYDRFLRSVLLAQGDFAAFLRAGPRERTDLLQEVTGTAIYRDLSIAAFRRFGEARDAHARLRLAHDTLPVLDPEARAQRETARAHAEHRLAALATELPAAAQRIAHAERFLELQRESEARATAALALDRDLLAAAPDLDRLSAHERASTCAAALATFDQLTRELARDTARLQALDTRLPQSEAQLLAADTAARNALAALQATETAQETGRATLTELAALDRTRAAAAASLRQIEEGHAQSVQHAAHSAREAQAARAALAALARQLAQSVEWRRIHAADAALVGLLPELQATLARWSGAATTASATDRDLHALRTEIGQRQTHVADATRRLPPLVEHRRLAAETLAQAIEGLRLATQNLSSTDITLALETARDRIERIERLIDEASRLRTLAASLQERSTEAAAIARHLAASAQSVTTLTADRTAAAALVAARQKSVSFAEKILSLEQHRAGLRPDEPCPLCGSLHHPFASPDRLPPAELTALRHELAAADSALRDADQRAVDAGKLLAAHRADEKRIAAELLRLRADHDRLQEKLRADATPLALAPVLADAPALTAAHTEAGAARQRLSDQAATIRRAESALHAARNAAQESQSILDRAEADLARFRALADQAATRAPALETALAAAHQNATTERDRFTQAITPHLPLTPASPVDAEPVLTRLRQRADAFQEAETASRTLLAQHTTQTATCETLDRQSATAVEAREKIFLNLAAARTELAQLDATRREKFGDRTAEQIQEQMAAELRRVRTASDTARAEVDRLRSEHTSISREKTTLATDHARRAVERDRLLGELQPRAAAAGFASLDALRAARLPDDAAAALVTSRRQLDERRVALASRATTLQAQLAALPSTAAEDAARLAELRAARDALETERSSLDRSLGETLAALRADDAQRLRQTESARALEAAHREFAKWDKLRALIGSADGLVFARFAQGLTLQRLTALANQHLAHLNPRYTLRCAIGEDATDLELEIVDHFQADVVRPVRSLSGGETFLASLALALGLSDLASGRTTIDSLFIDEGFGSLDGDTLETAMSALENLQARGKTIGIISHVAALQERIPTQIVVKKESGGTSRVTILN